MAALHYGERFIISFPHIMSADPTVSTVPPSEAPAKRARKRRPRKKRKRNNNKAAVPSSGSGSDSVSSSDEAPAVAKKVVVPAKKVEVAACTSNQVYHVLRDMKLMNTPFVQPRQVLLHPAPHPRPLLLHLHPTQTPNRTSLKNLFLPPLTTMPQNDLKSPSSVIPAPSPLQTENSQNLSLHLHCSLPKRTGRSSSMQKPTVRGRAKKRP